MSLRYLEQIKKFLPKGKVFNFDRTTKLQAFLLVIAAELQRIDDELKSLVEINPSRIGVNTATWEQLLNIPRPIQGANENDNDFNNRILTNIQLFFFLNYGRTVNGQNFATFNENTIQRIIEKNDPTNSLSEQFNILTDIEFGRTMNATSPCTSSLGGDAIEYFITVIITNAPEDFNRVDFENDINNYKHAHLYIEIEYRTRD